jgi:hypothetical protein
MLKPYICVACEKVIIGQDGVASLIGLFSKIIFSPNAENIEIPSNAVAPKQWSVFSSWDIDPGDENKEWFFCLRMSYPNGNQFGETFRIMIKVEANKRCQVNAEIAGFPIGDAGPYTVSCWIEESGKIAVLPIEFKIDLERVPAGNIVSSSPPPLQ